MTTFTFHLKDMAHGAASSFWGEGTMYVIGLELKKLFDEVCTSPLTSYSDSDYWWDKPAGDIGTTQVLCYFLPSRDPSTSLAKKALSSTGLGGGGTTVWNSKGGVSEVYVQDALAQFGGGSNIARGFAVLAFHEMMHNKRRKGDSMHGEGGLAAGKLRSDATLNEANIKGMAASLSKLTPQNTSFL